ncbi:MAG: type II toxin-antitoxin system PemK/MazF family toxin [Gallionellaceae bacterium]|nr:type II toxin-antitoxin system PemK/MazF family toxin [Gallionellaceae bacterium]
MTYKRFEVVRVPFPFSDKDASKNRPALVLSDEGAFNAPAGHSVMAMITSEAHSAWPLDCALLNLQVAGLPAPSKVRFKLFTLDHRLVHGRLGQLDAEDAGRVQLALDRLLGV